MKAVRFSVTCHWGFSVKVPTVSKAQSSLTMPPPSSIIGAISMPLAKRLRRGEVMYDGSNMMSSVASLSKFFIGATARLLGYSRYWEDVSRYLIRQFQQPSRRGQAKYLFGAIPTGKVYAPGASFDVALLLNEEAAEKELGSSWENEIRLAASQISRFGSKESIVHSSNVSILEMEATKGEIKTCYYFPLDAATPINSPVRQFHHEEFWEPDWRFGGEAKRITYIVPGLSSMKPCVEPLSVMPKWTAYVNGDLVLFAPPS